MYRSKNEGASIDGEGGRGVNEGVLVVEANTGRKTFGVRGELSSRKVGQIRVRNAKRVEEGDGVSSVYGGECDLNAKSV